MTIWSCKAPTLALGLALLAGCSDLDLTGSERPHVAQAALAGGSVMLTAPEGYCIDEKTLRQNANAGFALIARCDTMGAKGFFAAQELALISVTTAPQGDGAAAPSVQDLTAVAAPARVLDSSTADGVPLVRLAAASPVNADLSAEHWRGAFAVNGQLVGLALYAPEDSPALGDEGAEMLRDLAQRTKRASTTDKAASN